MEEEKDWGGGGETKRQKWRQRGGDKEMGKRERVGGVKKGERETETDRQANRQTERCRLEDKEK